MRIWHAIWDSDRGDIVLWGEKSFQTEEIFPSPEDPGFPLHPALASFEEMRADLGSFEIEDFEEAEALLILPTFDGIPVSSHRFKDRGKFESGPRPELANWRVTGLRLKAHDAINMLTFVPNSMPEGLKLGSSFLYWREVSKLLLELLTRGRFLPGVMEQASIWHAHWHLIPSGEKDYRRMQQLAKAMPPICRALDEGVEEERGAGELLETFIAKGGDALIKMFLSRHSLVEGLDQTSLAGRFGAQLAWLEALTREDSSLKAPEHELLQFDKRLRAWSAKVLPQAQQRTVRVCFKIREPSEDSPGTWTVSLLLQSRDHPEDLISAEQLWAGDLGFLKNTDARQSQVEEQFLRDLGRAHQVFPQLKRAMDQLQPVQLKLSTEEAYAFLKESVRLLEELDFGVLVPSWWSRAGASLGLALHVESPDVAPGSNWGFLSTQELLSCSWRISIAGEEFGLEDFRALIEKRSGLIEINGRWVELQPDKLEATARFIEQHQKTSGLRFSEALRYGFGLEGSDELLPVVSFNASGWIEQMLTASSSSLPLVDEPEGFLGVLRPYQKEGVSWMTFLSQVGVGGCLADDMGLGKTIQLLALLLHERALHEEKPAPVLLIVPMSTLDNWEQEAKRFAPQLKLHLHHGSGRIAGQDFLDVAKRVDIVLTTYSLAFRDEDLFTEVDWGRIVLDEAQNIKNIEAKQTKAVRNIARKSMTCVAGQVPCQRLALTGTPLENHLDELWSIFDFLNPGLLGQLREFRSKFSVPIERYRNDQAAQVLSKIIQPFVLRRLKSDPRIISDLPEKIEMEIKTGLTEEQAVLYRTVVDEMIPQVDAAQGIHRKGLVLATITRLKQICNHPSLFLKDNAPLGGRSGKLSRLEELLEVVLAEGDRVLIFTQYAQMGHLLKAHLQERFDSEVLFLHGALSKQARDKLVTRFRLTQGPPIFILSLKAGGFGLNLTEANQVIHYDQWWNPAVQEQATDRAYRIGQKRTVQVRTFLTTGTLEERISAMLQHKRNLAEQVVGATKSAVTQMSTNELRTLLQYTGQITAEEEVL